VLKNLEERYLIGKVLDFEKIYDIVIGCGMVTAYYSIKKSC
jgi:hypothetical protein